MKGIHIGEVLVEQGAITKEQLNEGLKLLKAGTNDRRPCQTYRLEGSRHARLLKKDIAFIIRFALQGHHDPEQHAG